MPGEGSGAPNPNDPNGGAGADKDLVPKADHQRALDDMHKFKLSSQANEKLANDLKTRLEALEAKQKTESGDFKGLYEQTKAQLDTANAEKTKLKESVVLTQKHSAVQAEVMKLGLKPEFMPILEKESLDSVVFETTSQGRFLVTGADLFAQDFQKRFPSAFAAATPPVINNGGGGTPPATGDWDAAKLFALEQECKTKKNMAPYNAAISEYLAQKKKARAN